MPWDQEVKFQNNSRETRLSQVTESDVLDSQVVDLIDHKKHCIIAEGEQHRGDDWGVWASSRWNDHRLSWRSQMFLVEHYFKKYYFMPKVQLAWNGFFFRRRTPCPACSRYWNNVFPGFLKLKILANAKLLNFAYLLGVHLVWFNRTQFKIVISHHFSTCLTKRREQLESTPTSSSTPSPFATTATRLCLTGYIKGLEMSSLSANPDLIELAIGGYHYSLTWKTCRQQEHLRVTVSTWREEHFRCLRDDEFERSRSRVRTHNSSFLKVCSWLVDIFDMWGRLFETIRLEPAMHEVWNVQT